MSAQDSDDGIFPIFRDNKIADGELLPVFRENAPILERIRERRQDNEDNIAEELGNLVGRIIKTDDKETLQRTSQEFEQGFVNTLSESLGVEANNLNTDYVNQVTEKITEATQEDAIEQQVLEELGLSGGNEEKEKTEEKEGKATEEQEAKGDAEEDGLFNEQEQQGGETSN